MALELERVFSIRRGRQACETGHLVLVGSAGTSFQLFKSFFEFSFLKNGTHFGIKKQFRRRSSRTTKKDNVASEACPSVGRESCLVCSSSAI